MNYLGYVTSGVNSVSKAAGVMSAVLLVAMGLLTASDVTLRYTLNFPIRGTLELLDLLMAMFVFLGLADNTARGGDVLADFLTDKWPPMVRRALDSFAALVSAGLYALIAYGTLKAAIRSEAVGDMTPALLLPVAPFQYIAAAGIALLTAVYVTRVWSAGSSGLEDKK